MTTTQPHSTDPATASTVWTAERIRDLGAVTDLRTAAAIFGISRTVAYDLARHDRFPVPIIRIGGRYKVPVATILTALHIHPDTPSGDDLITGPNRAWINVTQSEATPPAAPAGRVQNQRSHPR